MKPTVGRLAFDQYTVDLETRELSSGRRKIALQDKPFRLLVAFLERPEHVISRPELHDNLWPADLHVDREAGLNTAVRKLRRALRELGDGDSELLETVPRVGYRLALRQPPSAVDELIQPAPVTEPSPSRFLPLPVVFGVALAAALVVLGLVTLRQSFERGPEPMPRGSEQRALYVEARALLSTMGGDLVRARELLLSVTVETPDFAPAHAYLAEAGARLAMRTAEHADLDNARRAARRALELDPESAVAHRVLAMVALNFDWDVGTAGSLIARALQLGPGDPINQLAYAAYASALGRHGEAITAIRRAVDLDPESMAIRSDAGYFLLRAGRPQEAVLECAMVLRLDPENTFARDCLLTAYTSTGNFEAARPHAVHLLKLAGAPSSEVEKAAVAGDPRRVHVSWELEQLLARPDRSAVRIATHYLDLGDKDNAFRWLERAARARLPLLAFVPQHAGFSAMRDDSQYQEILRTSGLDVFTPGDAVAAELQDRPLEARSPPGERPDTTGL